MNRKVTKLVGQPRATVTTLTVDFNDLGSTLATGSTLTSVRFVTSPSRLINPPSDWLFALVDEDAYGNRRTMIRADVSAQMWSPNGLMQTNEVWNASENFTSLILERIPMGSQFEIDYV
jgi:hypothetical protein